MSIFGGKDKDKEKLVNSREDRPGHGRPVRPSENHVRPHQGMPHTETHAGTGRPTESFAKPHLGYNRPSISNTLSQNNQRPVGNLQSNANKPNKEPGVWGSLVNAFLGDDEKDNQQRPTGYGHSGHGQNYGHSDHGNHGYGHQDYGHHGYGHQDYGNHGYGHSGHGNHGYGYGQTPADLYKPQKGNGVLGTIVEAAVNIAAMKEMNEMQIEAEERRRKAEEEAAEKAAAVKEDYSMEEGYPSFCPACGAPTTGARFCEYCDVKVF